MRPFTITVLYFGTPIETVYIIYSFTYNAYERGVYMNMLEPLDSVRQP